MLIGGGLIALILLHLLDGASLRVSRQRFEAEVRNHVTALRRGGELYREALYGLRNSFNIVPELDRGQFQRLTTRYLAELPGLRSISWLPRVPDSRHEDPFPVSLVAPRNANRDSLASDLGGNLARLSALREAARRGTLVASPPRHLTQAGGLTTLLALPVYHQGPPLETPRQRLDALRGFVQLELAIGPLLNHVMSHWTNAAGTDLRFEDRDAPPGQRLMHRHLSRLIAADKPRPAHPELRVEVDFPFANRRWRVIATPASALLYPRRRPAAVLLPLGVLLFSSGLAAYLRRTARRDAERARLLDSVVESQQRSLRTSQGLLRTVIEHAPAAICLKDRNGDYLIANQTWQRSHPANDARLLMGSRLVLRQG